MSQKDEHYTVIFDTEACILVNGNISVKISRQGARCLQLLLDNPLRVISNDEFIEVCWKKHGTVVSDNTVRQTLFQLRKNLSGLGAPADTLKTLPRKGYQLTPGIIKTGTTSPSTQINLQCDSEIAQEEGEIEISNDPSVTEEIKIITSPTSKPNKDFRIRSNFLIILSGLAIFSVVCWLRWEMLITPLDYSRVDEDTEHLYFQQNGFNASDKQIATAKRWLSSDELHNVTGRYVYINRSEQQNLSLFICAGPLEDKNNACVPVTVLGDF